MPHDGFSAGKTKRQKLKTETLKYKCGRKAGGDFDSMLCLKMIQNYFHLSTFKAGLPGSARKWHFIKVLCVKTIVVCLGTIVAGHFIKVFCLKPIVVGL